MENTSQQFQLLKQRRFLPYFITQFLGAFNDNVFKTALLVLITISYAKVDPHKVNDLNNLGAGLFIFPFFLFSATAGQLADKYDKKKLVQIIKFAEILICGFVALGFYLHDFYFLLAVLFLLGTQAAFFSPVKYSILPQYLKPGELLGGNGLVEMGTFIAILVGTIVGGLLIGDPVWGKAIVSCVLIAIATCGFIASLFVPPARQHFVDPNLKINWEPFSQTFQTLRSAIKQHLLFWTMLGISWFWFYGSVLLTQIPNYTQLYLGGTTTVMTLLLTTAALGIGIGSLICEKLCRLGKQSGEGLNYLKLIPLGALGLTLFTADFSFIQRTVVTTTIDLQPFLQSVKSWHIILDLFFMGLFGGIYSVPLYVLLQAKSANHERSQIVAANNILNAIYMTFASVFAIVLLRIGLSIPQLFFVVSLLNAVCTLVMFAKVPEFLDSFYVWLGFKATKTTQ